ncbi:unnamed protein product [Orchesella dallaii]|uniref:Uncharacterized protein n=1 Tax=Orchesella dallaii TaxID=48710 RepID=A0ABP1R6F0_9HEXA
MDLFTIFLVFCITFIIWWDTRERRRSTRFPPGPPRLPIIGSLLSVAFKSSIPSIAFAKLAKIYGDVMYVKMGSLDAVVFSSHEAANEIFNHDKANDRVTAGFVADRNMDQNMGK